MSDRETTASAAEAAVVVSPMSRSAGLRRIMYPEVWPVELRAAVILGFATLAVYGGSWAAPIVERPASPWGPGQWLLELGEWLGGQDTRPYHAVAMLLHLVSATFVFAIV